MYIREMFVVKFLLLDGIQRNAVAVAFKLDNLPGRLSYMSMCSVHINVQKLSCFCCQLLTAQLNKGWGLQSPLRRIMMNGCFVSSHFVTFSINVPSVHVWMHIRDQLSTIGMRLFKCMKSKCMQMESLNVVGFAVRIMQNAFRGAFLFIFRFLYAIVLAHNVWQWERLLSYLYLFYLWYTSL